MNTVYLVIFNCGDGSNAIEWYCDPSSIEYLRRSLDSNTDEIDFERYASGDGLQVTKLVLPNTIDLDEFARLNAIIWSDSDLACGYGTEDAFFSDEHVTNVKV